MRDNKENSIVIEIYLPKITNLQRFLKNSALKERKSLKLRYISSNYLEHANIYNHTDFAAFFRNPFAGAGIER